MKLSTRVRYGLRMMLNLALNSGNGPVFLNQIARDEEISEKYLSQLIIPLRTAGLVTSTRGSRGGYRLNKPAAKVTVGEIFSALEGEVALIDCLKNSRTCSRSAVCLARDVWQKLNKRILETLNEFTLADLVKKRKNKKIKFYEI